MSRKLIITIIVLSIAALDLLTVRQAQINTVNEMTKLHEGIDNCVSTIEALKIEIETGSSPAILNNTMSNVDGLNGIE